MPQLLWGRRSPLVVIMLLSYISLSAFSSVPSSANSISELATAQAQIAAMPKATSLPPSYSHHRAKQVSNTDLSATNWQAIGPSPFSAPVGSGTQLESGDISAVAIDQTTSGSNTIIYIGTSDSISGATPLSAKHAPNTGIYAPTNNSIWKSVNNGASWYEIDAASPFISQIVIDPANSQVIYALSTNSILKSTDGGITWNTWEPYTIQKLLINPFNDQQLFTMFQSTFGGYLIDTSSNGGATWSTLTNPSTAQHMKQSPSSSVGSSLNDFDVAFMSASISTMYASMTNDGLYSSTNNGTTWTLINGLPSGVNWPSALVKVAPSNSSIVYTIGDGGVAYYSTDDGVSWSQMLSYKLGLSTIDLLAVDTGNSSVVYAVGSVNSSTPIVPDVFGTANALASTGNWQNLTNGGQNNANIHNVQSFAIAHCQTGACPIAIGTPFGIFSARSPTATPLVFSDLNTTGLSITNLYEGSIGPNFAHAPLAISTAVTDSGNQCPVVYTGNPIWTCQSNTVSMFSPIIDQTNSHIMYGINSNRISIEKSTNQGVSWQTVSSGLPSNGYLISLQIDPSNDLHLIASIDDINYQYTINAVYESINGGTSWYQSSQTFLDQVDGLAIDPNNSSIIYVTTSGSNYGNALWKTIQGNSGHSSTYTQVNTLPFYPNVSLTVAPFDLTGNTLYALSNATLYETVNGGTTWSNITGSVPQPASFVMYQSGPTRVLVVTSGVGGVFFSTTNGASWYNVSGNLPQTPVSLAIDAQSTAIVVFSREGDGAWSIGIPQLAAPDTIGIYQPASATFFLKYQNTYGYADLSFPYGPANCTPISGDWTGKGYMSIGVYCNGSFFLKNSNAPGNADITFSFGTTGDIPVVGDWTGKGYDSIGVYRPSNATYYLRNTNTSGNADIVVPYGGIGDKPFVGDWTGSGITTIGIYRPSTAMFYLRTSNTAGPANLTFPYGIASDVPVAGDWTGQGFDTVGIDRNGSFYLRYTNTAGNANLAFSYGSTGAIPLFGNWQ